MKVHSNADKINFRGIIPFLLIPILLLTLTSCNKDTFNSAPELPVTAPVTAKNLVIVTDNDPGSYLMIKIVGLVRSAFPDIQITYLQCKKFDIMEGAFLLNTALKSFPEKTVIAGIIEPGASGKRLVYQVGSKRVFAPDNALSTWIFEENPGTACYYIENPGVLGGTKPDELSFEDFYARAICSLINDAPGPVFGSLCRYPQTYPIQEPYLNINLILGQVLFTDNFGNCITNIPDNIINKFPQGTEFILKSDTLQFKIKLGVTYSSVPVGENVCFVNSSKLLELSVNYGDFSGKYNLKAGAIIQLQK